MANHKSALKRAKQNQIKQVRNRAVRTRIKNVVKQVLAAIKEKPAAEAHDVMNMAQSVIDKGVSKGVIHKKTASRKISRLSKKIAAME